MRKIFFIIAFLFSIVANANTYYIATAGGGGNDANSGTIGSPRLSLGLADTYLVAGDTLFVRGGTYTEGGGTGTDVQIRLTGLNGTLADSIIIINYPGEVPIFDFSGTLHTGSAVYGIYIENSDHFGIKGLRFTGLAQNPSGNVLFGFILADCDSSIVERCVVDNIGGQGYYAYNSDDIMWKNNDVHTCSDPYSSGDPYGGSNGFSSTGGSTSTRNTYYGNRAWFISDDGWDFYGSDGYFTFDSNWSFYNGLLPDMTPVGDGDGWKLGPTLTNQSANILRVLTNNLATKNRTFGFDQNNGNCRYTIYNNTSYDNGSTGYFFGYYPSNVCNSNNNISYSDGGTYYGSEIAGTFNSWSGGYTLNDAQFVSIDPASLVAPRNADGSLPTITYMHLATGSNLIGTGTNVGFGLDLGYVQYSAPPPTSTLFRLRTRTVIH